MSRAERVPQYRGDLRVTTLPEMLSIIDRTRVAGVIEAVRGETRKSVYLDNGYVVHAASTDLADSLGAFLRRTGRLSDGQFRAAMERRSAAPSGATANTSYTVCTPDFPRVRPARIVPLALKPMSAFVALRKESVTRFASGVPAAMSLNVLGRSCGTMASG